MAKKAKDETNVTRISASDSGKSKRSSKPAKKTADVVAKSKVKATKAKKSDDAKPKKNSRNPLRPFFGYFAGAWKELRQVHWPTRRATWSLTGAVLAFAAFFVVFILLLDALFKFIFELLLK